MLRISTLFLVFSSAGEALSFDCLFRSVKSRKRQSRVLKPPFGQRLIQLEVSVIYLASFLWKINGRAWFDGTALYDTLRLAQYNYIDLPIPNSLTFYQIACWGVLVTELSLATLVWVPRFRPAVLCLGIILHCLIEVSMNIPLFEWVMMFSYLAFLDGKELRRFRLQMLLLKRKLIGRPLIVRYDQHSSFQSRLIIVCRALDLLRFCNFAPKVI